MHFDLHRHLEASHSPAAVAEVARAFDLRSPTFFDEGRQAFRSEHELANVLTMVGPSDDSAMFWQCIAQTRAAYISIEAIGMLARLAFVEAAKDCDGFEMRISLFSMARTLIQNRGLVWRDVSPKVFAEDYARPILLAVLGARDEAFALLQTPMLVRLGLSRTFESEPHYQALVQVVTDCAPRLAGLDVLGILEGPEKEPLPPAMVQILNQMREHLPDLTLHAGEFEGSAAVDRALALRPNAIGHGVHSLQSPATMERLAKEGVTLEVCLTSNRLLIPSALRALEQAQGVSPLVALQRAGVHCVMGTDDPTPMGTSFRCELQLAEALGVDMAQLERDSARRWSQIAGESS